jgi:hypothetical protein
MKRLVETSQEENSEMGELARLAAQLSKMVEWADRGGGYIPSCPICNARIQDNESHDKYCTWAQEVTKARGEMR